MNWICFSYECWTNCNIKYIATANITTIVKLTLLKISQNDQDCVMIINQCADNCCMLINIYHSNLFTISNEFVSSIILILSLFIPYFYSSPCRKCFTLAIILRISKLIIIKLQFGFFIVLCWLVGSIAKSCAYSSFHACFGEMCECSIEWIVVMHLLFHATANNWWTN